ncbi:putative SNF2 family N-terminal domain containing protein [Lyophyllum shimeji]|uniref:SNF2 family N-terminal domain containing protein n=1 Tax=Lyophyllum shimeji TaxID=47721 RepID=A0A9P3PKQ6_LYOSH|nr:putative SNF2 family N-terminal domain containing protein [Lyophyllum shimeji]
MPAFQPLAGVKRKSDSGEESSRKKVASDGSSRDASVSGSAHTAGEEYWMVQWRNPQTKKHKTWDGDAILVASAAKATLYDIDGKTMAVGKPEWPLHEGKAFDLASKTIELDRRLTRSEYLSGRAFGSSSAVLETTTTGFAETKLAKQFVPPKINQSALLTQGAHGATELRERGMPLQPVALPSVTNSSLLKTKAGETHWTANWRKPQHKKHQTWEGDAYVSQTNGKLVMMSEEGKFMGSITWKGDPLVPGYRAMIGGKEVEFDSQIKASQLPTLIGASIAAECDGIVEEDTTSPPTHLGTSDKLVDTPSVTKFVAPTSFYGATVKRQPPGPLHDPNAENAVVMKAPTKEHIKKFNKRNLPVVPVVLDPVLARRMRPHQIEGVKFMYECVMGLRKHEGQGCILADEMGLGKTLQMIALVWTLLKQNPYASTTPAVEKVLIVCPVSLVNNWKAEFHKWLGRDRLGVVTCDKDKKTALMFMNTRKQQVLIIGYERLRTVIEDLASMVPSIGLIICDEGHRLKSASNKTTQMFKSLRTLRRIILSGTPIQNDLGEFHAMADFCNPGLLDEYSTFRRVYEVPILKSRAPDASSKDMEIGEARTAQLLSVAKSFVLRRDATLLHNVLPPKHEHVVFVTPTALQLAIFSKILHPDKLDDLVRSSTAESLALITMLTKVSSSPILLKATADKAKLDSGAPQKAGVDEALSLIPARAQIDDLSLSGKLLALSRLLEAIRSTTEEKCVLVSHYTSTLNILEAFCRTKRYSYFRLDGQTPATKRQELVNTFNKSSRNQSFVFLLSSKAGGVGINLIGASRLCLIDSDWNPSHDLQSMARCHRDGQKRPVYIYRFLTAGTIDEKIYQRQVTKLGLSSSLIGSGSASSKSDSFTRKDLRDIFRIDPDTPCNTHDLLECPCETASAVFPDDVPTAVDEDDSEPEQGFVKACDVKAEVIEKTDRAYLQKKKAGLAALGEWKHINCLRPFSRYDIQDDILRKLIDCHGPPGTDTTVSQPKSQLDKLLAIDLENLAAGSRVLTVRDVPGGTISYVFQKSSSSTIPGAEAAE